MMNQRDLFKYFSQSPIPACLTTKEEGRFIDVSKSFLQLFEFKYKDVIGNTSTKAGIITEKQRAGLISKLKNYRHCENIELTLKSKKGKSLHVLLSPIFIPQKKEDCILFLVHDITERKLFEEKLRKNELLLQATQKLTKAGGWEWDVSAQEMAWTDETYTIHDLKRSEIPSGSQQLIAKSIECYLPEDRSVILEAFRRCAEYGEPYDLEMPLTTFKGRHLWIRTAAKAIKVDGEVNRVIGNIVDITDIKQAQINLKNAHDELENRVQERTAELAGAIKDLKEKESMLQSESRRLQETNTALKVIIQHREDEQQKLENDILNNLRKLVMPYLEKLSSTALTPNQQSYLDLISSNLKHIISPFLHNLTSAYLDFTPREIEVANLVRDGKSAKDIASFLNSSVHSVEFHKHNIRRKLGLTHKKTNLRTYLLSLSNTQKKG